MQDLNDKMTGGTLAASEWNQVPSEIQNVIEALGITLSAGDLNQLGKAIAGYVSNGQFYTDSGSANTYILSVIGSKQRSPSYTDGFTVSFTTGNPNTAASTVNVGSLGIKNIKLPSGLNPDSGDIAGFVILRYDNAAGVFILQNPKVSAAPVVTHKTVAKLKTDVSLTIGQIVGVEDYTGDSGSGLMIGSVVAAATGTDDGGSFIDLDNGLQWKQNFSRNGISSKQFGVLHDWNGVSGTDNSTQLQKWVDYSIPNNYKLTLGVGPAYHSTTILGDHTKISDKNGVQIEGEGSSFRDSRLIFDGAGYALNWSGDGDEGGATITRWRMSNMSVYGNKNTTSTGALNVSRGFLIQLDRVELGSWYKSDAVVLNATNVFNLHSVDSHIYCAEGDSDLSTAKGTNVLVGSIDPDTWSSSNVVFEGGLIQRGDYGVRVDDNHVGSLDNLTIDNVSVGNNREENVRIPDVTGRITTVTLRNPHLENAGRTGPSSIGFKNSVFIDNIDSLVLDNCHSNGANVHFKLVDISSINILGAGLVEATVWNPILTNSTGFDISAPTKFSKVHLGPINIDTTDIQNPVVVSNDVNYFMSENPEYDVSSVYTPSLILGSGSVTYDIQKGWFSTIGDMVFFEAHIDLASVNSPSGVLQLSIPKAANPDADYRSAVNVYAENLDLNAAADVQLVGEISGTSVVFKYIRDTSAGQNVASSLTANSVLVVSGQYKVIA